jgi:hypothetical protein
MVWFEDGDERHCEHEDFDTGGLGRIETGERERNVPQQQRSNGVPLSSLPRAPFDYFHRHEQCLRATLVCVNLSGAAVDMLPPASPHVIKTQRATDEHG